MALDDYSSERVRSARRASRSAYRVALDVVLTGIVVILPIVVTVYVLNAALGIVVSVLDPIIKLLSYFGLLSVVESNIVVNFLVRVGIYANAVEFVEEISAMFVLAVIIVLVGVVARSYYGERLIDGLDVLLMNVPAIGSVYKSFRRMGDAMLDSDVQNFRSVKLVEFPRDGTYVIGFETARSPATIRKTASSPEMQTLFLPLAPNPVMGGFLAHIPEDQVMDVDMTVEEGVQSIITSGVAVSGGGDLSADELREMGVDEDDIPPGAAPDADD